MGIAIGRRGITMPGGIRVGRGGRGGVGLGGGGGSLLPFSDAFTRADGAIGNGWSGATWTVATNKAVNTPTLGSELYTNGAFAADANWSKGTGWTIAAGVASHSAGSAADITEVASVIGSWFRAVWTLLNYSAGTFTARPGRQSAAGKTANGTYTDSGRATATTSGVNGNATAAGDIDNLSLKQITLSDIFVTRDFGRADVDASVKVTLTANNPAGLILNLDSASSPANFVFAEHNGTNVRLTKCVAGTYTEIINTTVAYSAGAVLELKKVGTTYQVFYNITQRGGDQTISDAGIISNTVHGMFSTYEGNSLDDFTILAA